MKSILYESRVELLKIISAAISIGTIVLLSHVLGDKFLISYVVIQTLLVVFTSVIDFGQNVTNKNIEIPENTFRSQRIPIHFFLIALTIYFVVSFYWFSEDISYMVIFLMPISILSSTYNLRWLTVKRRSGNVFSSVLLGEFSLSILRLTSVIIGLILGYEFFELALLIFPIVVSLFLSKLRPINKLSILSPLDFNIESDKFDIFSYILSVFIAVKNQILSLFLPAVHDSSKSYVIMVSRIYGAIVILTSGLNARIPYSIKLAKIDNKWKSIKVILSLLLFSFILIALFYPMYVELVSSIFNVSFPFDFPLERQFFFALIVFGIVQSSMIVSLQCLNKNKTAILLDVLYLLVVIKFMTALK